MGKVWRLMHGWRQDMRQQSQPWMFSLTHTLLSAQCSQQDQWWRNSTRNETENFKEIQNSDLSQFQRKVQLFEDSFPTLHETNAISCSHDIRQQIFGLLPQPQSFTHIPQLRSNSLRKILVVSVASYTSLCKPSRDGEWLNAHLRFDKSLFSVILQCMHTTWYLSVEWQMTIIVAPILILALRKFGSAWVLPLIKLLIALSCLYGFKVSYENDFNAKELNL